MNFEPKNSKEAEIFAVEKFRAHVQFAFQKAMNQAGITQRDLAHRLEVSESSINQLFNDNCNVTIVTLAKLANALDMDVDIELVSRNGE